MSRCRFYNVLLFSLIIFTIMNLNGKHIVLATRLGFPHNITVYSENIGNIGLEQLKGYYSILNNNLVKVHKTTSQSVT